MTIDKRLAALGWDERWQAAFEAVASGDERPVRVSLEHNHVFRVLDGQAEQLAELAGRLRNDAAGRHELPTVGDWVVLRPATGTGGRPQIRAVLPRRSAFSRRAAGRETVEQVVAANIDTVLLVSGLDQDFNLRRMERYLVMARASRARPVIVLNKADLADDLATDVAEMVALAPDVPVHAVRARGREIDAGGKAQADVDALRAYLGPGQTVALLGSSGVGKSTIINALIGRDVLKTGDVREQDGRGRHTSVHRQLVVLDGGGLLIDTPGMREMQLWEGESTVEQSFPEIDDAAAGCRFRDCRHDREPGCAVKAAVAAGTIEATRYDSYLRLQAEREELQKKREEKLGSKALKAMQKQRGR